VVDRPVEIAAAPSACIPRRKYVNPLIRRRAIEWHRRGWRQRMDSKGNYKSNLGNDKYLKNAEKNPVTGIKTSDMRKKKDGPVTADDSEARESKRNRSSANKNTKVTQHANT
jgi:hypothetical protein